MKMKTVINGKATRTGIRFVSGIINKRSPLPILSHVHFAANGDLQVSATDLDVTLQARLPGVTAAEGQTTFPARVLVEAVAADAEITLETDDQHVTTLLAGNSRRTANGLPPEDYPPEIVPPESAAQVTLPADLFIAGLKQVAAAMSTDQSRYVLNSVCLEIESEKIQFVATDGRRLQMASLPTGGTPLTPEQNAAVEAAQKVLDRANAQLAEAQTRYDEALKANPSTYAPVEVEGHGTLYRKTDHHTVRCSQAVVDSCTAAAAAAQGELNSLGAKRVLILPSGAVHQIVRLPLDRKAPGTLTLSDWTVGKANLPYCRIAAGGYTVTAKLIEGNYPNYRQVIPAENKFGVPVNIKELGAALAIAAKATSEKENSVKLVFTKNVLEITANSTAVGAASVTVPCGYHQVNADGSERGFSIAFNPHYLLDACTSLAPAGGMFTMNFMDELSPLTITNPAGNTIVIMPMRMN